MMTNCPGGRGRPAHRRGRLFARRPAMAILVLLGLLGISLGLSYATLRSQATTERIQSNSDCRQLARVAASAGVSVALGKMHDTGWSGVGSTLSGSLSNTESYAVQFTAGDPRLTSSSSDYAAWPRRVTLTSTGTSVDPTNPAVSSTKQIRAIVQLVPRAVGTAVTGWSSVLPFVVYQFGTQSFELQLPCRLEGPLRLQGAVTLASSAPSSTGSRQRYLSDLLLMSQAGLSDYRPLTGPVSLPTSVTSQTTRDLMTQQLGVTLTNITQQSSQTMSIPTGTTTYRLYPGSPLFTMTSVGSSLANTTLAADPVTNPLGLFYRSGSVTVGSNVTIRGTLLASDTIQISGSGIVFEPLGVANVQGQSGPLQLPVAICDTFRLETGSYGTMQGNVVCWSEFRAPSASQSLSFTINGRVVTNRFRFEARSEFTSQFWTLLLAAFQAAPGGQIYFPNYVAPLGANPVPGLTVRADATTRTDHYQSFSNPLYAVRSDDTALVWDLLDICEL